jgi:IclR family acetate operon transcriptional repressor
MKSISDNVKPMTLRTVERALALVEFVADAETAPTMKEAARALGINLTTCYHLAHTLQQRGYLVKDGRGLRIGAKAAKIHRGFLRRIHPGVDFRSVLQDLAGRTGETAYLASWQDEEVILQAVVEGAHPVRVTGLYVGTQGDTHCRASGKAVLAYLGRDALDRYLASRPLTARTPHTITDPTRLRSALSEIAAHGYAVDDEEFALGVCCLAAPFFGVDGQVRGAVTVSAPAERFGAAEETIREAVLAAAERVSSLLGFAGPYPHEAPPIAPAQQVAEMVAGSPGG